MIHFRALTGVKQLVMNLSKMMHTFAWLCMFLLYHTTNHRVVGLPFRSGSISLSRIARDVRHPEAELIVIMDMELWTCIHYSGGKCILPRFVYPLFCMALVISSRPIHEWFIFLVSKVMMCLLWLIISCTPNDPPIITDGLILDHIFSNDCII